MEYLLRQARDSRELIQLGFPKSVITRVWRRLKEEKARQRMKVSADKSGGKGKILEPLAPVLQGKPIEERLMSLESVMHKLENQIETLGATECSLEEIEASLDGTPALGLKQRFKCSCGVSSFVALHVKCTKCGKET